jgi:alcohol dehydrogenase
LTVGDRVSWSVAASCGVCFYCQRDLPQKCVQLFKYGHEAICDDHPLSGGLADYCHLKAGTGIVRLPDGLSDEVACPANCATATVAASLRIAGDCRDRVVLIQGAGMLGLTAAAMTRAAGARVVIVADVHPERIEQATRFGASVAVGVAAGDHDLRAAVDEASSGHGADIAIELSGSSDAAESALSLLGIGGRLILVGAVFPGQPLALSAETVVRKLLRIEGVHNYKPADLVTAVEFLAQHQNRFPFAELVGARFSLNDAPDAFEHAVQSRPFRTAVLPRTGEPT